MTVTKLTKCFSAALLIAVAALSCQKPTPDPTPTPTPVKVTGVSLDRTEVSLTEGESIQLTASVEPANADNRNVGWTTDNPAVATVTDGRVTAVSAGEARITVRTEDGGKTAQCQVTVIAKAVPVTGVSLDRTEVTLRKTETVTLVATVSPSDATDKAVVWSSTDSSVATVDRDGKVTAVKEGTATVEVTSKDEGFKAGCVVTVEDKDNVEDPEEGGEWPWR